MYRLSSFRPNSLGTSSSAGDGGGGGGESPPPGTPLTEQPMASGSGVVGPMASSSSSNSTAFHRQSSQTGSGSGQISPPSTSIPNVPTYETIDVANLSQHHHLSGYNPAASTLEYSSSGSASGASGSGHSQTSACGLDSSTAPIIGNSAEVGHSRHFASHYSPYGQQQPLQQQPPFLLNHRALPNHHLHHHFPMGNLGNASASYYFSRHAQRTASCYPSSVDGCSNYYSVYGYEGGGGGEVGGGGIPGGGGGIAQNQLGVGAAGRSTSESGIYSPTRRLRPSDYAQLQQQQMQLALMQQHQQQQSYSGHHHSYHHHKRRKSSADSGGSGGSGLEEDFDIAQAIFALIALTAYLVSLGSSLALAYFLAHHEQDSRACALTLAATLLPSVIVNILSLKWLLNDNHRQQNDPEYPVKRPDIGPCGWTARILLHIVLLGPALRYVDLLRFGVCSWSEKRRIEDGQHKGGGSGSDHWLPGAVTLPSLSTTLPRPRYLTGAEVPGLLPAFDVAATTSTSSEGTASSPGGRRKPNHNSLKSSLPVDYYMLTVYEDRDSSLLSLFAALLQCSLQLVLQLCSLLAHYQLEHVHQSTVSSGEYNHQFTEYVQLTVIGCSLFQLAWSLASYHRSLRRASLGKRAMSTPGVLLQFLWHLGTTAARLLAVALFVSQFGAWLVPVTIGHWGVMTVWIMHQGSGSHAYHNGYSELEQGEAHSLSEYAFNMLVGAIYLVQFINVKDEPTRYKYAWYYGIVAAENAALAAAWAVRVSESAELEFFWLRLPALGAVLAAFGLGIAAMQLYYWCAHPSGRPLWANKAARCC